MTMNSMKQEEGNPIDWSRPIEAVHDDGRVVAVDSKQSTKWNAHYWAVSFENNHLIFDDFGKADGTPWRIRNVAQPDRTPAQVARMEALVRRVANWHPVDVVTTDGVAQMAEDASEALAILNEIDPIDRDPSEASDLALMHGFGHGHMNFGDARELALAALKRGRELQKRGEG